MSENPGFDRRKKILLGALLQAQDYLTSGELAGIAGIAPRTARYELKLISEKLEKQGAVIESLPGRGYRISPESGAVAAGVLDADESRPVTPDERSFYIVDKLLSSQQNYSRLPEMLHISESTLDRDLERCSAWFRRHGLVISRRKDVLTLKGSELSIIFGRISYCLELSSIRNIDLHRFLDAGFSNYEEIRTGFDSKLPELFSGLTDAEYHCLLIYMLQQPGAAPEEAAGLLGIPVLCSEEYSLHKALVSELVLRTAAAFSTDEADGALLEDISRVTFPAAYRSLLPPEDELKLQDVEKVYPEAAGFALGFNREFEKSMQTELLESQIAEAGLCYAAFLERGLVKHRKRAAIVCGLGTGTAQLLSAKLGRLFSNLELCGTYPESRLAEAEAHTPDFLITTSGIESAIDTVRVSRFLDNNDFDKIVLMLRRKSSGRELFRRLCSPEDFHTDLAFSDPEEMIHHLCTAALGSRAGEFETAVIERERIGSTFAANLTAVPHAVVTDSDRSFISVAVLDKPVRWGNENVQLVLLLKLSQTIDMAPLFDYIYSVVSNKKLIKRFINEKKITLLLESGEGPNA